MPTPVLPGGSNTFIPNHQASGNLVIGFSRSVGKFPLNDYVQIKPVTKDQGKYLKVTPEEAGRILDSNLSDFVWADGSDRPQNNDGTEEFVYLDYRTTRYDYSYKLGRKATEQADWAVAKTHQQIKAQQAMTGRTVKVHGVIGTDGNWDAAHYVAAPSSISGVTGRWDESTSVRQDIKRSLNYGAETILKSSLSVVRKSDLRLVLNPEAAHRLSETQEIVDHIKGSPEAYSQVKGGSGRWSSWGLPDSIYGFPVVVEDSVKVTSRRGAASATRAFVMPRTTAYLLARPGSLVAPAGDGPNFSTVCIFAYEEMAVEEFDDGKNRRLEGHVVDDFDTVMTASVSGFKFNGIVA